MQNLHHLKSSFQKTIKGRKTDLHVLENSAGTQVGICNYGARITHFIVKDKTENQVDTVLGFNNIDDYVNAKERYHGVTVGPFANRIANGSFKLNGEVFLLEKNNGSNCLHGGSNGFHDKVWEFADISQTSVALRITTVEAEGGFPGELTVVITYSLNEHNELLMEYHAETLRDTVINLTNHAYFNLNGTGDILAHQVKIEANQFVGINENCIPSGELKQVAGTPFDFRTFKMAGQDIYIDDEQLLMGKGYDHSFEIKHQKTEIMDLAATVIGDISGLKLEVLTTEPAVQFYTGNYLGGQDIGKNMERYEDRSGFCLETQHHPDSPNQAAFPSTVLKKGEIFSSITIYKISY
jgi:aldose 1-epimerase